MGREAIRLLGYRFGVYTRVVRLVLIEKQLPFRYAETDPFVPDQPADRHRLHPFGRVPVLIRDGFAIYETAAIPRYLDAAFPGSALTPPGPAAAGRMQHVSASWTPTATGPWCGRYFPTPSSVRPGSCG